jgi:hypothetical protein
MSMQDGTDFDDSVGEIVQRYINKGYEEILVTKDEDGGWTITCDNKRQ